MNDNLRDTFTVYILLCIITSLIYTLYYYRTYLKEAFKNASNKQKFQTIILTLVTSTIFAPMVFIEYLLGHFKEEES